MRLDAVQRREVVGRQILDTIVRLLCTLEPRRLQPVQRLIGTEMAREVGVPQHAAADRVDAEERRLCTARLNCHQRSCREPIASLAQYTRELFDRRCLEERRQGELAPELLLNAGHQAYRQQRMA